MAWTYGGMPFLNPPTAQSYVDSVRFLIGDTDTTDQQLQDGEIIGLLTQNSSQSLNGFTTPPQSTTTFPIVGVTYNPYEAAISGCVALAAKYTRRSAITVGDLSVQASSIAKQYRDMIPTIRSQSQRQHAPIPYAALLQSEGESDETNTDLKAPQFEVGQDDNPDGTPSILGGTVGFSQAVPSG